MDDKIKNELDGLFKKAQDKKQDQEVKRNDEAEAQAAFLAEFLARRESVIIPAFKDFSDYLKQNGWLADLEVIEERAAEYNARRDKLVSQERSAGAKLIFYKGSRPFQTEGFTVPYFSAFCNKRERKAFFISSTIGNGHGGSGGGDGDAKLSELTSEFIQGKLLAYFKKLLKDSYAI